MTDDERKIRAAHSKRAWNQRNAERMKEYRRKWRENNPDKQTGSIAWAKAHPGKMAEYRKTWIEKNPDYEKQRNQSEEHKRYMEEYKLKNPNYVKEKAKRWRMKDPERTRMAKKAEHGLRRARIANVPHERIVPQLVYLKDDGICGICGKPLDLSEFTMDHIIPISKGGGHVYPNVHSAHRICNIRRGTKPLEILYSL